ncbi:MAG: tetratricopeptide repeat protein, partial [Cyanobacteria bacterium P01_H01_bin.121]
MLWLSCGMAFQQQGASAQELSPTDPTQTQQELSSQAADLATNPAREGQLAEAKELRRVGRRLSQDPTTYQQGVELLQRSLEIYTALGVLAEQATTLNRIGIAHFQQQNFDIAFQVHLQALDVASRIPETELQDRILRSLSWALGNYQVQRTEQAIQLEQRRRAIYQARGDAAKEAVSLGLIGHIYFLAEQYTEGITAYQQAIALYRELGDRDGEARMLWRLGDQYLRAGQNTRINLSEQQQRSEQYQQAIQFYQQAIALLLALAEQAPDPEQRQTQLLDLAEHLTELGREISTWGGEATESLMFEQQALELYQQLGQRQQEADLLFNRGDTFMSLEQYDQALASHHDALAIYQALGLEPWELIGRVRNLSLRYTLARQDAAAIAFSQMGTDLTGDRTNEAFTLSLLADQYRAWTKQQHTNNLDGSDDSDVADTTINPRSELTEAARAGFEKALQLEQRALAIYQAIDDAIGAEDVLIDLATTHTDLQEPEQARAIYQQLLEHHRGAGNREQEANLIENVIAKRYKILGDYEQAFALYDRALELYRQLDEPFHESIILHRIGSTHAELKQYEPARVAFEQSLSLLQQFEQPEPWQLNWQSILSQALGDTAL